MWSINYVDLLHDTDTRIALKNKQEQWKFAKENINFILCDRLNSS